MPASAFRIEYGDNVTISQAVYEDLYIAGGTVTINATVHGDLVIAGGTVVINDTVTNDILAAGGNITFNGFVGDDIRCAGGNVHIYKSVSGDVVVTGGTVIIHTGATAGGLIASGGNITVDGNIDGEARSGAGTLFLNGNISKGIDCRGGSISINGIINGFSVLSAENIIIGSRAKFYKDVRYYNKSGALDFKNSLINSEANYDASLQMQSAKWYFLGAATLWGILWYLGMVLVMIFMVEYLFPFAMEKAGGIVAGSSLKSFGIGLLFFIAIPVAVVIALVSLVGVPVGLLLLLGYIILAILSTVITSVVAANWYNWRSGQNWNRHRLAWASFGFFVLIKLLSSIPFFGWLLPGLLVCIAFGSIIQQFNWRKKKA